MAAAAVRCAGWLAARPAPRRLRRRGGLDGLVVVSSSASFAAPSRPRDHVLRPRWPLQILLGVAAFAFALWWMYMGISHGIGICPESFPNSGAQFCVDTELTRRRLYEVGIAAFAITLGASVAVALRFGRLGVVGAALALLAGLCVYADA